MNSTPEDLKKERRRTEDLLRKVCKHLEQIGAIEDGVMLCVSTRSWILGELEDIEPDSNK